MNRHPLPPELDGYDWEPSCGARTYPAGPECAEPAEWVYLFLCCQQAGPPTCRQHKHTRQREALRTDCERGRNEGIRWQNLKAVI